MVDRPQQQQQQPSTSGRQPPSPPAVGLPRVPSKQSVVPTREQLIWQKVEASVWLVAAAFVIWYGNGTTGTLGIVLHDMRVRRLWAYLGLGFLGVDFLTFLYLSVWVKRVKHRSKDAAKAAPSIVTTETLSTTAAGLLFTVAYWPVWRYLTPLILVVLFMGFTMLAQLRPSTWQYRRRRSK